MLCSSFFFRFLYYYFVEVDNVYFGDIVRFLFCGLSRKEIRKIYKVYFVVVFRWLTVIVRGEREEGTVGVISETLLRRGCFRVDAVFVCNFILVSRFIIRSISKVIKLIRVG